MTIRLSAARRATLDAAFVRVWKHPAATDAWVQGRLAIFSLEDGPGANAHEVLCYGNGNVDEAQALAALCYLESARQLTLKEMFPDLEFGGLAGPDEVFDDLARVVVSALSLEGMRCASVEHTLRGAAQAAQKRSPSA